MQLKSAAALNITSDHGLSARDLPTIERPLEVQASRLNLPVCGMEQEIVEAIKQNDVLILCGETGESVPGAKRRAEKACVQDIDVHARYFHT